MLNDKEKKELEEEYPELINSDSNETLIKLMHLYFDKNAPKFFNNDVTDSIDALKLYPNPEMKKVLVERSKEKFNEFENLSPEEREKKIIEFHENTQRFARNKGFMTSFREVFNKEINIDPKRLFGLTDGIFGMVITLLAFGIALPEVTITTRSDFFIYVHNLIPNIGVVIVSFIFVSSFWIYHHEFLHIKTLNLPFLWLHILFLVCISFIPFTTTIISSYSQFFLADIIFGFNVFITVVTFLLLYRYASNHDFFEEKVDIMDKVYTYHTFFIIMGITLVVIMGDFFVSSNFIYLLLFIPIISMYRYIRKI